jgi:hypothetical protein
VSSDIEARKLLDRLTPNEAAEGALLGLIATSYECEPHFFETDWLPTVLGLGLWDDRGWASRIALETALQKTYAVSVLMDGRCVGGAGTRPLSHRIELQPSIGPGGQMLHAKVTLLVYERAIRLLVTSANLTQPGYRENREVASTFVATAKKPAQASLLRQAVLGMAESLGDWWTDGCKKVHSLALERLDEFGVQSEPEDARFVWSGHGESLHRTFVSQWDKGEAVRAIHIVSPFWSDEDGSGPIARFVKELREHASLEPALRVRLYADADPYRGNRPKLPASFGAFDDEALGVPVWAAAVDPAVLEAEVLRKDFVRTRTLHAKAVVLEGPRSCLAYWGSANFTEPGWGFGSHANLEAGVILRARARDSAALRALIPPVVGSWVRLDGKAATLIGTLDASVEEPPWPAFVRSITLRPDPNAPQRLALSVSIHRDRVKGTWSVGRAIEGPTEVLIQGDDSQEERHAVLDEATLQLLLKERELQVRWWAWPEGRAYPINVALEARDTLPISPESALPTERSLLFYYQGKIAWEDLFPPPPGEELDDSEAQTGDAVESTVDTSKIQSYMVRDFVEALEGIRDDLKRATRSEPSMRQAVKGPVSPLALARQIRLAMDAGERTAVACTFEFVELLSVLHEAEELEVEEKLQGPWLTILSEACAEIEGLLQVLPTPAVHDDGLAQYVQTIRSSWGVAP